MNLYNVLSNRFVGMSHYERLFAAKLAGGEIKELEGVPPLTFTANGQPLLDYLISGNTVHSGTPTPDNPVMPQGTGERTGNLIDADIYYGTYKQSDGTYQTTRANLYNVQIKPFTTDDIGKTFTFAADISPITGNARLCANINGTIVSGSNTEKSVVTFTVETADDSIFFNYGSGSTTVTTLSEIMLVQGSTAPTSYIPYGYKIPISSANTTTPVYLGEVQTTRRIKKLVLTGEEDENWRLINRIASVGGQYFNLSITTQERTDFGKTLCSHYIVANPYDQLNACCVVANYSQGIEVRVNDPSTDGDIDAFKSYLVQQYANGTPVTVWYVLETEETGIVNEPLMKIGDYADTLSMEQAGVEIPTARGTNTLDVLTDVKPSNVYIKYKS